MTKTDLFLRYPWYQKHEAAIDTVILCLQVEAEQVLDCLDKKLSRIDIDPLVDDAQIENLDDCAQPA